MVDELPPDSLVPDSGPLSPAALPDVADILGPRPMVPPPAPPMVPGPAGQDPRSHLLQALAAGLMLGLGPRSGAAAGISHAVEQLTARQRQREQQAFGVAQQEFLRQQTIAAQQQRELDSLAARRENALKSTLLDFKNDLMKTSTEPEYNALVDRYSSALRVSGFRGMTPDWFYRNMKFVPPSDQQVLQKQVDKAIATSKALGGAPVGSVSYISPTTGQKVTLPFLEAQQHLGIEFKTDAQGNLINVPAGKGTEYDQKKAAAIAEYTLKNGHAPEPNDAAANDWISQRILELTPKPVSNLNDINQQIAQLRLENLQRDTAAANDTDLIDANAPDPGTANIVDRRTGMTPSAIYQNAKVYALAGAMPSLGLGSRQQVVAARNAIQNKAAAMVTAAGLDIPTLRAEYAVNKTALNKVVPFYTMTAAAADVADQNLALAEGQSARVARTGSPLLNRYLQWTNGQTLTGNPELTRFEVYIYTAAREYAKVTSGGAMSAQGLTDSANREAQQLLNAAQTPAAFQAAVSAMRADMQNVTKGYANQINRVSRVIGSFLGAPVTEEKTDLMLHPPLNKFGARYVWDGAKYVRQD